MTYQDALEFMGYRERTRHPIEILGYEYTTQGMNEFRSDKPDVESELVSIIKRTFEEHTTFPAEISENLMKNGTYLFLDSKHNVIFSSLEEIGYLKYERIETKCKNITEAALKIIKEKVDPQLLQK